MIRNDDSDDESPQLERDISNRISVMQNLTMSLSHIREMSLQNKWFEPALRHSAAADILRQVNNTTNKGVIINWRTKMLGSVEFLIRITFTGSAVHIKDEVFNCSLKKMVRHFWFDFYSVIHDNSIGEFDLIVRKVELFKLSCGNLWPSSGQYSFFNPLPMSDEVTELFESEQRVAD